MSDFCKVSKKRKASMKIRKHHRVWLPRIIAIAYVLFLSLFALDTPVFSLGFLMHLLPSFLLAGTLAIAWRWARVGGTLFLGWFLVFFLFFHTWREPMTFVFISLPLLIIGGLFLAQNRK